MKEVSKPNAGGVFWHTVYLIFSYASAIRGLIFSISSTVKPSSNKNLYNIFIKHSSRYIQVLEYRISAEHSYYIPCIPTYNNYFITFVIIVSNGVLILPTLAL